MAVPLRAAEIFNLVMNIIKSYVSFHFVTL
ncbi:hypothetical protein L1281_002592 [Neisseria sp. HSC-16F19]|nr:hypothetical protein [Neisseria sp. HSC-16F19]